MTRSSYVLLCSGQSNIARITHGIAWSPPSNLKVWRYNVMTHGEAVGEGFHEPSDDVGTYANFYAACMARAHPEKSIYVINVSKGGTNLCQWLPGASSINMMNAIESNVAIALDQIEGADSVDEILWWGHESDAAPTADTSLDKFVDDFLTVIEQIDSNPWSAHKPPIRLHKLHPGCNQLAAHINHALERLVTLNPSRMVLLDTTGFNYSDSIHLDPDQKEAAADYAFSNRVGILPNKLPTPRANLLVNGNLNDQRTGFAPWWVKGPEAKLEVLEGVVQITPGTSMAQWIPSEGLFEQVLTISMEDVSADLRIQVGNHVATVRAGSGRRQAAVALHSLLKGDVLVVIGAADEGAATFSRAKLEHAAAATAYTHTPHVPNVAERFSKGWRTVLRSIRRRWRR